MNKPETNDIERQICTDYENFEISIKEISKKFKVHSFFIYQTLQKYNIPRRRVAAGCSQNTVYKVPRDDHPLIIEKYKRGASLKEIGQKYGVTESCISIIIRTYGVQGRTRKYRLKENFFETINSEEKAYFLGFLFADGHNNTQKKQISLQLACKDKEILDQFNKIIYLDEKPLYFRKGKAVLIKGKPANRTDSYCLEINSTKISDDLAHLGCVRQKTIKCFPPTLKLEFFKHFLRGYFDGDGCLCIPKIEFNRGGAIQIAVNKPFGLEIIKELSKYLDINIHLYQSSHKNMLYYITIGGIHQIKKFMDFIYQDAQFFLKRKKEKYEEFNRLYEAHCH